MPPGRGYDLQIKILLMECVSKVDVGERRREGTGDANSLDGAVTYCLRSEYLQPRRLSQLLDLSRPDEKPRGTREMRQRRRRKVKDQYRGRWCA
jgi:hypothetical protein